LASYHGLCTVPNSLGGSANVATTIRTSPDLAGRVVLGYTIAASQADKVLAIRGDGQVTEQSITGSAPNGEVSVTLLGQSCYVLAASKNGGVVGWGNIMCVVPNSQQAAQIGS
jgi:hypothetical protein